MNPSFHIPLSCRLSRCAALVLLFSSWSSVSLANESPSPAGIAFFESQVRPLLIEHCYECHANNDISGGLALDSRDGLASGGDSGPSVAPGAPENSLLIAAVRYDNLDLQMPPSGKLSQHEISILEKWIESGAPDPRVENSSGAAIPTGMSIAEGRAFWAFKRISNPRPPEVENRDWCESPLDAFVLSWLEAVSLQTAKLADRRSLIRRVTFDLIGLPPTPQQIEEFVSDESPNAYGKLVDRLLSSPQYGVRWGRHWLDVARYADSNGLDENLAFGNAWRYRDYVVDAFNDDKPFDQFLIEQIAGDLLPSATEETKIATGYLVLGAKVLAEPDREKLEMDTIDEQLDAMGKAFLGMTFGCVRCHDHKFDPIKQSDYYSLAAIFKSTRTFGESKQGAIKHWYEHDFATEAERVEIAKIDALIAEKKKQTTKLKNDFMLQVSEKARAQVADYLEAATLFDVTASLAKVAKIAEPRNLHPRILHHARMHLEYRTDDDVLGPWHRLRSEQGAVHRHFSSVFDSAKESMQIARSVDPKAKTTGDRQHDAVMSVLKDPSGLISVPANPLHALNPDQLELYNQSMEAARIVESQAADLPSAMGVTDAAVVESLPVHIRGSHRNLGSPVAREYPAVMRTSAHRPIFPSNQSGRLQLARWMADTRHPLTARVYVNRIWAWHFGRGLVESTENFGVLGGRPSHPALLDYLARHFVRTGWSTKELHRLILKSSVYKMDSVANSRDGEVIDPDNRLLWKFPVRRHEAESIRDGILAVSGGLNRTLGGKPIPLRNRQVVFIHTSVDPTKYDSQRRAIYLPVIRNNLYSFFSQFDFPDPTMPTGIRSETTVAPQALLMMNAELVMNAADRLAKNLLRDFQSESRRIEQAYQLTLGREATLAEIERAKRFLDQVAQESRSSSSAPQHRALSLLCQSLFASNEFIFVR